MRTWSVALAGAAILAVLPAVALAGWSEPARVTRADDGRFSDPAAAVGGTGEAVVAWVREPPTATGGSGRVFVATARRSGAWSAPRPLSGVGASGPRVAVGARGDAIVVWSRGRAIAAAVRRGPGGRWVPGPVVMAGTAVRDIVVSMDATGRATILWTERRGSRFAVSVATRATRTARSAWSVRPAHLSVPGPAAPSVALSPSHGALAAWVERGRVRAARTTDGRFEEPMELSEEASGTPGVALSPAGAALAAWSSRLPGGTSVMLSADRGARDGGWEDAEDVGVGAEPAVALNDAGDAVVAWDVGEPGASQGIEAVTRRRGGAWRSSTVVRRRSCSCAVDIGRAEIGAQGDAIVSWSRDGGPRGGGAGVIAAGGGAWGVAPDSRAAAGDAPAVAMGPEGTGLAVWAEQGRGAAVRATLRRR
ncbi:MAG: hypothetical protein AB7V42_02505 [Thermoleophilia bacterium]